MSRSIQVGDIVRDTTGRQGEVVRVLGGGRTVVKFAASRGYFRDGELELVVRAEDRPVWPEEVSE